MGAVNTQKQRMAYSGVGPGMFEKKKPDIMSYSHFYGNFGPGKPGGTSPFKFDGYTSAATPVAAGVAAMLLSYDSTITPKLMKEILMKGAEDIEIPKWDNKTGQGVINAKRSFLKLKEL